MKLTDKEIVEALKNEKCINRKIWNTDCCRFRNLRTDYNFRHFLIFDTQYNRWVITDIDDGFLTLYDIFADDWGVMK